MHIARNVKWTVKLKLEYCFQFGLVSLVLDLIESLNHLRVHKLKKRERE